MKRAVTPKVVKRASRALHPFDNAVYSMQRSAATAIRSGGKRKASVASSGMGIARSAIEAQKPRPLDQQKYVRPETLARFSPAARFILDV